MVVTEGTSTEPGYLKMFKQLHGSESAALKVIPLGADPRAVVERAIDETPLDPEPSGNDSVWAVFDRDDHERFNEAVDLARGNNIKTAVSNPCFELWGILHYELLDAPTHRQSSGKRFEDAGVVNGQHGEAVRRARELLSWNIRLRERSDRRRMFHDRRRGWAGGGPAAQRSEAQVRPWGAQTEESGG